LFEGLDASDELPKVEDLTDDTLVIRYPDESQFDEIRKLIREHIDKPSEKKVKVVRKSYVPPPGLSPQDTALWLKINHPDWDIVLDNKGEGKVQSNRGIEQLTPEKTPGNDEKTNGKSGSVKGRVDTTSRQCGRHFSTLSTPRWL
jgi:hypothetical protein